METLFALTNRQRKKEEYGYQYQVHEEDRPQVHAEGQPRYRRCEQGMGDSSSECQEDHHEEGRHEEVSKAHFFKPRPLVYM
jgi:hypothetical protein